MDANLRYKILGGLIGGGIGFLAGSIICDLYFPEYEEVNPNNEGDEELDVPARRRPEYYDRRPTAQTQAKIVTTPTTLITKLDKKSLVPYHNLGLMGVDFDADSEFDPTATVVAKDETNLEPDIYVIPKDEYGNDERYPAIELTYFSYDDVLLDPSGQSIDDVVAVIGDDTLELFGQESEDADTVYIRNEVLGYDYQINRIDAAKPKLKPAPSAEVIDDDTDDLATPGSRLYKRLATSSTGKRIIKKVKEEGDKDV
jgi:hypothetical protein